MFPTPTGTPCGRPAILTDPERGILVCEEHRPAEDAEVAALRLRFLSHVVPVVGRVVRERGGPGATVALAAGRIVRDELSAKVLGGMDACERYV